MAKYEKTLQGDLEEINRKIKSCITENCPKTKTVDSWETEAGGIRLICTVFEKQEPMVWSHDAWAGQPHLSLAVNLFDTGAEIRLCAISSGGSGGALMDSLKTALAILDSII